MQRYRAMEGMMPSGKIRVQCLGWCVGYDEEHGCHSKEFELYPRRVWV